MRKRIFGKTIVLFCMVLLFVSCNFFNSFSEEEQGIQITSLTLAKSNLSVSVGEMSYIAVSVKPTENQKDVVLTWTYDKNIISIEASSWGATITGLKEGQTNLKCSYNGYEASSVITVKGFAETYEEIVEPYIYSNTSIIQTAPGVSEKVFVSLYGGTAADIDGYSWTIDNPSVAKIEPTGQYCMITAKEAGYARIKITHSKATYPYYMGIYVFEDATNIGYITTPDNILTMNLEDDERTISVNLINGKKDSSDSSFSWEIINEDSNSPINYETNGNKAVITPVKAGSCTIRVTHPDSAYPLDILCRVISVVKNVYIEPDNTVITLSGTTEQTVKSTLKNIDISEYDIDGFTYSLDDYNVAEIAGWIGDEVMLKGKANGSCKLIIGHEKSKYTREVLVIVNGQLTDAIDASCYITTSQNYIRTKVGNDETLLNISLKGGEEGDEQNFQWSVKSTAFDGSGNDVISIKTTNGTVGYSRAAAMTFISGQAYIEPKYEGTAVITITHPKIVYPTEVLVKVLSKEAVLEEPLYFTGDGLLRILNGSKADYTVQLKGKNKTESDDNEIMWSCDNSLITISANGNLAEISAPPLGTGNTISYLNISHNKSESDKKVMILTADTEEELMKMKALYSDKLYYNLEVGDSVVLMASEVGFDEGYDFSNLSWTVSNPNICTVEKMKESPLNAVVKGLKSGSTTVTVSIEDVSCDFSVIVYPIGTVAIEPEIYFTTNQNVITLNSVGMKQTININAINLPSIEYTNISWKIDDNTVATVIPNGDKAIVTACAEGTAVISVSHTDSQNTLKIYVHIGNEYVFEESDVQPFIRTSPDVLKIVAGTSKELKATLENLTITDLSGFSFVAKDTSIANVASQTTNGIAYIDGVSKGYTEVVVTHIATKVSKSVLVVVGNTEQEIEEMLINSVYLTTDNNTVFINELGTNTQVKIKAVNLNQSLLSNIDWKSADDSIAQVIGNGLSATIIANGIGYTTITASHSDSINSVTFYVYVKNDKVIEVESSPYISSPDVLKIVAGTSKELKATLENLTITDLSGFSFVAKDTSIANVASQTTNGIAYIDGVSKGYTEVVVTHIATKVSKSVLVVVGNTEQEIEEMLINSIYLTTDNNTVFINELGTNTQVKIKAVNLDQSFLSNIDWKSADDSIAQVIGNGSSATIIANDIGYTTITASHSDSINSVTFYVYVKTEDLLVVNPVSYIAANDILFLTEGGNSKLLQAVVVNANDDDNKFSFSIDNENIAEIVSQTNTGLAYIKPKQAGQAQVVITNTECEIEKHVLIVVENTEDNNGLTYLTTSSNVVAIGEGNNKTVSVSVKNSDEIILDGYTWTSSDPSVVSVVSQGSTAVLNGNSIGTAIISVTNKECTYPLEIIAQCVDPIAAAANPFIQLTSSVLTLNVSSSYSSITADLVGGTEADFSDFVWTSNDTSVCAVYGQNEVGKIRALQEGTAYITVSHPKAAYPAQILVVCDKVEESECYISVPSSIINMKPTDSAQTITASLINGTTTDKYNFTWSLDVYDVIDFVYSANVCTIEPKQQGQATITIHHPKSAYDQQIVVTVQEYTTFAFPQEYVTITQGTVSFETMQVPNTKVSTYVKYSSSKEGICTITGTNTTAQITAVSPGTTTVRAELIASSTGVVQASAEMMVYVKEAPANACYITSSSTIYTVQKGKSQTLSANLTGNGVITSDQQNLKWSTNDTDKISIAGIKTDGTVTGQSIYITALEAGEALITCSHEKAASDLQFFVVVPGSEEKIITFNKSYITLVKGSSGTTLKVNIENAESNNDYNELIWTVSNSGENEVCRVMGKGGQNVTIYPLNVGEAEVMAQLPDSSSVAKCTVLVEAGKSFTMESNAVKVQPYGVKKVKYIVSPPSANLTWTMNQSDDFFTYRDLGCDENGIGYVEIEGMKEGSGNLYCVTDGNAKGNLQVRVSWDYKFTIDKQQIDVKPGDSFSINYTVNPSDADIFITGGTEYFTSSIESDRVAGSGTILLTALKETEGYKTISIIAKNPKANNAVIGTNDIELIIRYPKLTITPSITSKTSISNGKEAFYSEFSGNTLNIGDGEIITVKLDCEESAAMPIYEITPSGLIDVSIEEIDNGEFIVKGIEDYTEDGYKIIEGYVPTYKGSRNYPDGTPIKITDFECEIKHNTWDNIEDHDAWLVKRGKGVYNIINKEMGVNAMTGETNAVFIAKAPRFGNLSDAEGSNPVVTFSASDLVYKNDWNVERAPELDGTVISDESFKDCPWYHIKFIENKKSYSFTGVGGGDKANGSLTIKKSPENIEQNIKAEYLEFSDDNKKIVETKNVGSIRITISHGGAEEKMVIPINLVKRACLCTHPKE